MNEYLQNVLLEHLLGVPSAEVINASVSPDPTGFTGAYRFSNLRALVRVVKSVQADVENFAHYAQKLLAKSNESSFVSGTASHGFDAGIMSEQVLLGFMRSHSPSKLNSEHGSSPVVASGVVRSHLEAIVFRADYRSRLIGAVPLDAAHWAEALKSHRDAGQVSQSLSMWVTVTYGLLSNSLHSGTLLTRGEIWALMRVVKRLADALEDTSACVASAATFRG
jgi:hypothetical protein